VHVIESGGDFFVQPPIVSAEKNDSLRIINTTNEDLVFNLGVPNVVAPNDQTKLVKKNSKEAVNILNTAVDGTHQYQIVMLASGKKAKGNSDPVLIIDN
jgi:hypothetical protein